MQEQNDTVTNDNTHNLYKSAAIHHFVCLPSSYFCRVSLSQLHVLKESKTYEYTDETCIVHSDLS